MTADWADEADRQGRPSSPPELRQALDWCLWLLRHRHQVVEDLARSLLDEASEGPVADALLACAEQQMRSCFRVEEALMELTGFPDLERHRAEHRNAEWWLESIVAGPRPTTAALRSFFTRWLAGHSASGDARLVAHAMAATRAQP